MRGAGRSGLPGRTVARGREVPPGRRDLLRNCAENCNRQGEIAMLEKNFWLVYVALAGLAWGTYVPIIFYGGSELGGKANARLMAILCVGGAYFVIGVLLPLALFLSG